MISNKGPFLEKLGANIRRFRKERNMSLDTLAALCDYEKANLSRIESGKTNATVYTLYNISKVMGIEMCKFFEGYGEQRDAESDTASAA